MSISCKVCFAHRFQSDVSQERGIIAGGGVRRGQQLFAAEEEGFTRLVPDVFVFCPEPWAGGLISREVEAKYPPTTFRSPLLSFIALFVLTVSTYLPTGPD